MTRVSWNYFMKRRNISYASFANMDYDMYTSWCHARMVIPTEKEEYEKELAPFRFIPDTKKSLPNNPSNFDQKALNRKKKGEVKDICILKGLELDGNETKKELIQKLLELNNG